VRVRDLLAQKPRKLVTIDSRALLHEAIALLMTHNIGGLAVLSAEGALVGFLAERDIVRATRLHARTFYELRVEQVMRPAPLCDIDERLEPIMQRMTAERLRHLVVCEDGKPVGIVSVGDIVRYRLEQLEAEAGVLRDYVAAQRAAR
jgi:CBS domain-containing protein